jgi:hypothetical protein
VEHVAESDRQDGESDGSSSSSNYRRQLIARRRGESRSSDVETGYHI